MSSILMNLESGYDLLHKDAKRITQRMKNDWDAVVVNVGTPGSGKTVFSIQLAQQINGEIINVDSRQVYKGFCIGTAQPAKEELTKVKHHLVNCLDPNEIVSAGKYCEWVWKRIKKKIPPPKPGVEFNS